MRQFAIKKKRLFGAVSMDRHTRPSRSQTRKTCHTYRTCRPVHGHTDNVLPPSVESPQRTLNCQFPPCSLLWTRSAHHAHPRCESFCRLHPKEPILDHTLELSRRPGLEPQRTNTKDIRAKTRYRFAIRSSSIDHSEHCKGMDV
jgi:hypothetical protein